VSCGAPKKKDSKLSKEFQGRLSHASPQSKTPLITKFFSPREHADVPDNKSELTENVEKDTVNFSVARCSPKKESDKPSEPTIADGEYHLLIYKVILSIVVWCLKLWKWLCIFCLVMLPD
jgi:hypothetical protein